jgi:TetR/AcrR family transcriptional repressor of nem operon
MGRKSDARPRILEAASRLLATRAYASIGVAEICAEAGVPKGSFYYFFDSKLDLAKAVVDEQWARQRAEWSRVLTADQPLQERLRELFDLTAKTQKDALTNNGSVCGCLFGNLALETTAEEAIIRERLKEIFEAQLDMIEEALSDSAGELGLDLPDPRAMAKAVVAQLEGLVLFAKLFDDPAQLDELWANTSRLLGISLTDQVA